MSGLPDSWHWSTVASLGSVSGGVTKNARRDTLPLRRPYIRVANVYFNRLCLESVETIGVEEAEIPRAELQRGDILIVEGNGSIEQIGRLAIWDGSIAGCVHQNHVIKVRPREAPLAKWITYWLMSPTGRASIQREASSTSGLHTLSISKIERLHVPVCRAQDASAIVGEIEAQLARIDVAVQSLARAMDNIHRARASVLQAAVEGRLVPTEADIARSASRAFQTAAGLLAQTSPPLRPNRFQSRSTDVIRGHAALSVGSTGADLPEGWAWSALVDVARLESGHTPSRSHPEWWDGDVPWIGIPDARDHDGGVINDTEQHTNAEGLANSAARLLPSGTVCLSRTASVGYVVVLGRPMATSQDFVNWICTPALDPHWLRVVFKADRDALLRFGKGSVHKTIYFPEVLSLHVAVPPLAEQKRIVEEVDRRLTVLASLERTIEANLARCSRLRQSILKLAFEGRLVPQDETAPAEPVVLRAAEPPPPTPRRRRKRRDAVEDAP